MSQAKRVIFLCTGNSCRSQMGEGLLRHIGGEAVESFSAGTKPADRVHPLAVATMAERGIDISSHTPKVLDDFDGETFDLLITTCDSAQEECPHYSGAKERLHWSLPDPADATGTEEEIRAFFREVADDIERRINELLADTA